VLVPLCFSVLLNVLFCYIITHTCICCLQFYMSKNTPYSIQIATHAHGFFTKCHCTTVALYDLSWLMLTIKLPVIRSNKWCHLAPFGCQIPVQKRHLELCYLAVPYEGALGAKYQGAAWHPRVRVLWWHAWGCLVASLHEGAALAPSHRGTNWHIWGCRFWTKICQPKKVPYGAICSKSVYIIKCNYWATPLLLW